MSTQLATQLRPRLGDYVSIICFRYMRHMAEDTAGRAMIIAAGRKRGRDLIEELGMTGKTAQPHEIREALARELGAEGTRLCIVESVEPADGGYIVRVSESVCSMGVQASEPICVYTLGAILGAIEAVSGKRMVGKEHACIATGAEHCVFVLTAIT